MRNEKLQNELSEAIEQTGFSNFRGVKIDQFGLFDWASVPYDCNRTARQRHSLRADIVDAVGQHFAGMAADVPSFAITSANEQREHSRSRARKGLRSLRDTSPTKRLFDRRPMEVCILIYVRVPASTRTALRAGAQGLAITERKYCRINSLEGVASTG